MRDPMEQLHPPESHRGIRLLTLNIAHGRRLATHQALVSKATVESNLEAVARLIGDVDADVVALQEADGPSAWSGNFDHVEKLADLVELPHHFRGEHNHFGVRNANLDSGTALLTRLPLERTESHRFGRSWRDTKGFVVARVPVDDWDGAQIDVVSLHLEPIVRSVRRQQIELLTRTLVQRDAPLVVLGDFNCSWEEDAAQFRPLVRKLELSPYQPYRKAPTYPARRPWRRLDWVLISPELEFIGYRTSPHAVSDHLPVIADIRLRESAEHAREAKSVCGSAA